MFGDADKTVSDGQISIEREGALAFGNAPSAAICEDLDTTHLQMREGVFRRYGQRPRQRLFSRQQARSAIIGIIGYRRHDVRHCMQDQGVDISRIKGQGSLRESARFVMFSGEYPLLAQAGP